MKELTDESRLMLEAMQVLFGDDWDENDRIRFNDLHRSALRAAYERGKADGMIEVSEKVSHYLNVSDRLSKVKPQ